MRSSLFGAAAGRVGAAAGSLLVAVAFWTGLGGTMRAAPVPADPETCLPTCAIDGRSLVVAGNDPTTLAATITVDLNFTAAGSAGFGNFELFDGDRDSANWDVKFNCGAGCLDNGKAAPELIVELWIDPTGVGGSGAGPIATWTPGAVVAGTEHGAFPTTNDGWAGVTFPHDGDALIGANYQYALRIKPADPVNDWGWNAFKIRANGTVALVGNNVVAFLGAMNVWGDVPTIYPDFPALTNSPYDGTWSFKTRLPAFLNEVTVWDGDMDYGSTDCSQRDSDDPDTSNAVFPGFPVGVGAVMEGVARIPGGGCVTGLPADDNGTPGSINALRRIPGIVSAGIAYQLKAPDGQLFLNSNPSGNREWEQFRIQLVDPGDVTRGACPATGYAAGEDGYPLASDCRTEVLAPGVWEVQLDGMDLSNLNFWYFGFKVVPIPDYSIGRLVWYDANANGAQDLCANVPCAPELGIPGVTFTVLDGPGGAVVTTGVTDGNGEFLVDEVGGNPLPAGNYTVVVDAANLLPGGPLEGWVSTTGGETEDGVEVGLPVCVDTNDPDGCGDPVYAEAIFGYVVRQEECVVTPIKGGDPFVGAVHTYIANPAGAPAGSITVRTTLSKLFVDNTYGLTRIGYPKGHSFNDLVESDKMQLALYDNNDVKRLEFQMDYISASGGAPGGHTSLGVAGGDGAMILGTAANIFAVDTSLAKNFRNGMALTVDSPATDASYTPNATYPNWIFEVYYDVTFLPDAFGQAGFGYPRLASIHASPSKTGSNSEICVYPGAAPVAANDSYHTRKNTDVVVGAPGVLGNDIRGGGGAITAVLFTAPAHGTLVGGLNADGSFTYRPSTNFKGNDQFTYQAFDGTQYSTVATVAFQVR